MKTVLPDQQVVDMVAVITMKGQIGIVQEEVVIILVIMILRVLLPAPMNAPTQVKKLVVAAGVIKLVVIMIQILALSGLLAQVVEVIIV